MGCNIHVFVEVLTGGQWYTYNQPRKPASYELFGLMAGVRRPEKQMFPVKGIPDDASVICRVAVKNYGTDAHTISWLGVDELILLEAKYQETTEWELCDSFGYIFDNDITSHEWDNEFEDVRIVFFFDN